MQKKIGIILVFSALILYSIAMSLLYLDAYKKSKDLSEMISESSSFKKKLQEELAVLNSSQETLSKENEQLRSDSLKYLEKEKQLNEVTENLKLEIQKRVNKINELEKELKIAKQDLEKFKIENQELANIKDFTGNVQVKKQQEKIMQIEKDLLESKDQIKKQEALLHYNLGVAYTKEKNYEMALDEYRRALKLNPKDPDTYYNLAILYDDCYKNPKRAIENYKKYLELRPNAPDIDEIKEWILRLEK